MKIVKLNKDAERRVLAGHLWIFSNDINTQLSPLKNYTAGELVCIESAFGKKIAIGYINPQCVLCIRILSQDINTNINTDFFVEKIKTAQLKRAHYFDAPFYRLVFGESDRLPGVVIDQYNAIIVVQINTAGMELLKDYLIEAIKKIINLDVIILKCDSTERQNENLACYTEVVHGNLPETILVSENNCNFYIAILDAQKTGWFYDHRLNRATIATHCKNKRVLDVFSYCGAFSLPAAKAGATQVIAIDRSEPALNNLLNNAKLNNLDNIKILQGDALKLLDQLQQQGEKFDVIILDPPALIKRKKDIPAGAKHYQKLNEAALRLLNHNGILFSASCSMHLSAADLLNCIRKAAINTQREITVLEQCHQAPDHPIHPAIAETSYLKGFIITAVF